MALFAPYRQGEEVTAGWTLWDISIEPHHIVVSLRGADQPDVGFRLVHPTQAKRGAPRTPSFAVQLSVPEIAGALTAQEALLEAVRANDRGNFWRVRSPPTKSGSTVPQLHARALLSDGFAISLLGAVLAIFLAWHVLSTAPLFVKIAFPLTVLTGAVLRLALAPAIFLGAWPWSRFWPNVGVIWTSPLFAIFADTLGSEVYLTDLMLWANFGYACLMPVVLFVHASQLLRDNRAGLAAAAIVAVSPHHIRYSISEDAFVPSLVLTSLAFALIHTFMRDPARRWRWLALVALPFALWPGYLLRPLNILFVVVYLGAIALLHPEDSPRRRRIIAGLVVLGVGALAFVDFLSDHQATVTDATTNPLWIFRLFLILFWPPLNMIIHPLATAPAVLLFAIIGFWSLRRRGERRLAYFLLGWLTLFLVTHSYVVMETMQPRYHLHLLVPFTLLASTGAVEIFRRSRRGFALAALTIVLAPWIGRAWIQNIAYADTLEYPFVRKARDLVPGGCTVFEYAASEGASRFKRISERLANRHYDEKFSTFVLEPSSPDSGEPEALNTALRQAIAQAPGTCVYIYEGLNCWGLKRQEEHYAPECEALSRAAPLETVMEEQIPFRQYDTGATPGATPGITHIRFALSRVVDRSQIADGAPANP